MSFLSFSNSIISGSGVTGWMEIEGVKSGHNLDQGGDIFQLD